jgi:2-oxoglutarate ferredoxin oxidoreductase subunit gamma
VNVRFAGFGGQGVVMMGYILGKAAMYDGRNSIHTQSYGSASRGALTRSDVRIADGEIHDLTCEELDVLVAMSQQSYGKFRPALAADGRLFYESDIVQRDGADERGHGLAATDLAVKTFGKKIMANVIMLGFVNEIAGLVSDEAMIRTIRETVPPATADRNVAAYEEGRRLAREAVES